jgi:predicted nuclease of predicted toxin-antitoxin system
MSTPIYMDVHVPAAISEGLRRRGIDVVTAQDDHATTLHDEGLLRRATELGRVLFSQDDDLLRITAAWQAEGKILQGVIYAHQMRAGIGQLVEDLELLLICCDPGELANRVVYLPLR